MKKNIRCISEAISFLSGHFLYTLRISLPVMLLLAACLTWVPWAAIVPFCFLQGIMFRLLDVKERGFEVGAQRMPSVYRAAARNVLTALNPKVWLKALKYYFRHFRTFLSLTVTCLLFYGFVCFMVSVPQIAIRVIKMAIATSQQTGDTVSLPDGLHWKFYAVLFVINYLLSIVLADCLLPFPLRRKICRTEDAEIETIIPKKK
ncbi:MAG: hypothetical protein IJV06_02320 [Bacteroidaceae bacterium]|nr:hypothetical protein [Bacteroidaceae bacterium]